jgi:serine/threonine protein kinase
VPYDTCRQIAARLVVSLEALSKLNISHRDLKPSNILMNNDYETKICDFGEAKIMSG